MPLSRKSQKAKKRKPRVSMAIKPLNTPLRGSTSIRYQANVASTNLIFNYLSLARLICFSTTTTACQTLLEAVKINAIHFWLPAFVAVSATSSAVLDAPAPTMNVRIQDSAVNNFGPAKDISLVATDKGAYYCWRPRGVFRDWIDLIQVYQNGGVIFQAFGVDCFPTIQLDMSYQFQVGRTVSGQVANSITVVVDTTTANSLMFMYMDNYLNSSTEGAQALVPVQLATITVNDPSPDPSLWSSTRRKIEDEKRVAAQAGAPSVPLSSTTSAYRYATGSVACPISSSSGTRR